tara:strand:+ start:72 stop:1076 length:1005 start_codon:yes stop_codon:yes gene_type:complete
MLNHTVTFLGCGSWGAALGSLLENKGLNIKFWHRNPKTVSDMQVSRKHYLMPNVEFGQKVSFHSDIKEAIVGSKNIVLAIPSQNVREIMSEIKNSIDSSIYIINVAKGIERETLKTVSEVVFDVTKDLSNFVTVSGPSHAEEVLANTPTAIVSASKNISAANFVQKLFSTNKLRVYTNNDLIGVEIAGSAKNVIAIAAGFCDGFGYGDNTKSALMTRGIKELSKLGSCFGARMDTFFGLAGIGDLIVTCGSVHSRNRKLGERIGKGIGLNDAMNRSNMVAEGVKTAYSIKKLSEKFDIEMPICNAVYNVLYEEADPIKEVDILMSRDLKPESLI